jgi:mannose-6-phosphate isomerase-like protein (cupin superfamily)
MAVILEGGCHVSDMHDGEPLHAGTIRVWQQVGRATGAEAISLRVIEFAPGMSPAIRNDDCDQILYVLDLERGYPARMSERRQPGSSATIFIHGRPYEISHDTGIYIRPGQTLAVNNPGPDTITIISAQCPDPDRPIQFVDAPAASSIKSNALPIVRLADQKAQPTADRWYRVMVDDGLGSIKATQFVGSIPPGRAPDHFHNYEEVLFILKGEGRMWAGETNTPIGVGSCIYLPKGQVHCVENTGQGELRLMGVFYPAGSPSVRYNV